MRAAHVCHGHCRDADCPCCLGECDCLGDPYGPTCLPTRATDAEPGSPAGLAVLRDRAAHGEALHHPEDAAVMRHRRALRLGGGHLTAHERAGEAKGVRR